MKRRNALQTAVALLGVVSAPTVQPKVSLPGTRQPQFPYLETGDRTRLFYKDWGGATGPVVVFVHGWPLHSDMWQYQMLHLANQGMRAIAYDQRSCGRSTDPGTGYDCDTLADDLAAVIEQLGLRQVILVGHSFGGGQIVRYLSRHGAKRVSRIVLLSASLPFIQRTANNPDGMEPARFEHLRGLISTDTPGWLGHAAKLFFVPETSPEMLEWGVRMCSENSIWALTQTNHTDVETDYRSELPKIRVPTLVVHGDADRTCPLETTGRRTAQLVPGAELRVYDGAPHGLFVTHMDKLNADLLAFVTVGAK
jgi:pimeloyl-ACP methyl ester carboxylesterase